MSEQALESVPKPQPGRRLVIEGSVGALAGLVIACLNGPLLLEARGVPGT